MQRRRQSLPAAPSIELYLCPHMCSELRGKLNIIHTVPEHQFLKLSLIHKLSYFLFLSAAHLTDDLCCSCFAFHPMTQDSQTLSCKPRPPRFCSRRRSCGRWSLSQHHNNIRKRIFCILYIVWFKSSSIWTVMSVLSLGPISVIMKMLQVVVKEP